MPENTAFTDTFNYQELARLLKKKNVLEMPSDSDLEEAVAGDKSLAAWLAAEMTARGFKEFRECLSFYMDAD